LTLTYDDRHVPSDGSLDVTEWQRFAKRLRKRCGPFRFYHCGEYGDANFRPHYHACVFGLDFSGDRELFRRGNAPLFTSATLGELWPSGFSTIGALTFETAAYVARYIVKKVTGDQAEAHYGGRKPEYATMSRRPGIGAEWLERFRSDVYPSDQVVLGGRVFRPPRFYDDRLEEEELKLLKKKRVRSLDKENCSFERLAVREKVAEARAALQVRRV